MFGTWTIPMALQKILLEIKNKTKKKKKGPRPLRS